MFEDQLFIACQFFNVKLGSFFLDLLFGKLFQLYFWEIEISWTYIEFLMVKWWNFLEQRD